ncbi:MAG: LamG domain-containing protein, partial [Opitutae bacterium]|nr:LamG domain-containing protein [Opitutae bacterium]
MSCKSFMVLGCIAFSTAWSKPVLDFDFEGDNLGFSSKGRIMDLPGPIAPEYPGFLKTNRALGLDGSSWLVIKDPGEISPLDFENGDSITIETWVLPGPIGEGDNVYLIGKGRTNNKGFAANNQNYALRLRGQGGEGCVSFLFFSRSEKDKPGDWHRWTSDYGVRPEDGWSHVAVAYEFGKPKSVKGYVNGKRVSGKWDMGGATERPPVVDDDELWIGSALGGSRNNSFAGGLDEVAIHRECLSPEIIAKRHRRVSQPKPKFVRDDWPTDKVLVEVVEGFSPVRGWPRPDLPPVDSYRQDLLGFFRTTHKYAEPGVRVDRPKTFLLRALASITLPAGEHEWLVRSRWASRIWVDDELMVSVPQPRKGGGAHHNVPRIPEDWPAYLRLTGPGDAEKRFRLKSKGQTVQVRFETLVGDVKGKGKYRH